jgi:DNA-binding SARP family transcriptional activator
MDCISLDEAQPGRLALLADLTALSRQGRPVVFATRRSRWLLAHLALHHGKWVQREELIAALWPECSQERSRRLLETELWRLRDALRQAGAEKEFLISGSQGALRLEIHRGLAVDLTAFRQAVAACRPTAESRSDDELSTLRQQAISLYRGQLCPGVQTELIISAREQSRAAYMDCLETELVFQVARSNWAEVVHLAQKLIAEDSLLEHIHRHLIRAYWSMQDRARALAHYRKLEALLRQELDVQPMAETRALLAQLTEQAVTGQSETPRHAFRPDTPVRSPLAVAADRHRRFQPGPRYPARRLREMAGELSILAAAIEGC